MITTELNALKTQLKTNTVFNDNVFVYSRFEENNFNFQGITDQFDNYAFIELVEDDDETFTLDKLDELTAKGGYVVQADVKLIAGFSGKVDLEKAIESLIKQVNDLGHEVQSASINSELIYQAETGQDIQREIQLVKINFAVNKLKTFNRCLTSIC